MPEPNKITFKAFPALNGDCFIITYPEQDKERNILVDSGYPDTYRDYLLPELLALSARGGVLDLFIITHIDADHLMGAITFLKDNLTRPAEAHQIWHNTFRHIQPLLKKTANPPENRQAVLQQLLQRGFPSDKSASGKISAQQGTTIGALILKNGIAWNTDFNGKAVSTDGRQSISFSQSSIFLLSPGNTELANLARFWEKELRKYNLKYNAADAVYYDDAFEMMLSWEKNSKGRSKPVSAAGTTPAALLNKGFEEDNGVTNGSSIAFILEIQKRKLLLLGDAHPSVIERELVNYQPEGLVFFDLIKVSHHGSFNNTSPALLRRIDSQRYIFSANGKHNHPEKETIAHIVCRKTDFLRTLYFTYQTANSEFFNREDWKMEYNYQVIYLSNINYTLTL